MNKNKKRSATTYNLQQGNKKTDNKLEAFNKKSTKIEIGNESPQTSYDIRLSGHSTPIRKKDSTEDVEGSPELDYRCSPIFLPCTQEGGNEIAWDWQTSASKNYNDNIKAQNNVETPKRTKQLQKKRNSNSPLLQKPLKRKQVKMENIENIGKFAAELKALTERMETMQQNCDNCTAVKEEDMDKNGDGREHEHGTKILIKLDNENSDDIMLDVNISNNKPNVNIITDDRIKKKSNYDDLFDESVEDSMVKCSQEIEAKFNLCETKGHDAIELSTVIEEKEFSSISEKDNQYLTASNHSTESSKNSNIFRSSSSMNTSSRLRTYSNNSSKTNSTSNASILNSTGTSSCKSISNNNVIKHMLQEKDKYAIPNDSFDDCLATCVEDDKLLSKLSEYDFNFSSTDNNPSNSNKNSKQASLNPINNKPISNSFVPKAESSLRIVKPNSHNNSKLISNDLVEDISGLNHKEMVQKSFIGNTALENRKFFKTKSLSDQYFYHNKASSVNSRPSKTTLSSEKRFQSNSARSPVSTTFPLVKGQKPYESNKLSSINGVENAWTFNRSEEKESSTAIKYKSTSNLYSIKEIKESQPVQCTPEEIERKRLEAKMRLEAKRKLQQGTRVDSTPSEVPVKKSVKR
ncbi:uncharacterized protein LOC143179860 [Calliopsis andreniformis]|uniref:uncharacterized protein LOC143179860 n=1 Tax=Calliopsis andreniformis TaxID=337506 RepID=UPI003FCC2852